MTKRRTIEEIVQISEARQAEIVAEVMAVELPDEYAYFADKYEQIEWGRDRFLVQWLWLLLYARRPGLMFSSVAEEFRSSAALVKSCLAMASTIIDDVSDKLHDDLLLNTLLKASFEKVRTPQEFERSQRMAVELVTELMETAIAQLETGPMWTKVRELLTFDMNQSWSTSAYSQLLNSYPNIANHLENSIYNSHSLMFYIFADIDLIYSPTFNHEKELSPLREVTWHCQQMVRIGNWVSTWERELDEQDVSSGAISFGVSNRLFSVDELFASSKNGHVHPLLPKIRESGIEEELLTHWSEHREKALQIGKNIHSVDIEAYVDGAEMVTIYQLASRGKK